jgi:hypothetical protein
MRDGTKLRGHGYMELTGYAGALVGLSENGDGVARAKGAKDAKGVRSP